jgi:translation initiation factor 2 alpha subunit (eIF-2alpha)
MQLYTVPTSIDQQIEDLIKEQIEASQLASKGYLALYLESQSRIERLQAALKGLTN